MATVTGGTLEGPDSELIGASFDTRTLWPGELFVPIVAARDGHDFIADAIAAGAGAYLTSRPAVSSSSVPSITVTDTGAALMELAAWARSRLSATVVGITGSVGKTSTKDLVRAAVAVGRRVSANERSFNNEQGLPVTILGAPDDTEVLVLEMGMRGFGEIARLCAVGCPEIGVVTAVAPSHTARLGGIDGVARAKAELVEALPPSGVAVLNADDPHVRAMATHTAARVVTFGRATVADVRIRDLVLDDLARARFGVDTPWGGTAVQLAVSGEHMATNAAAAIAVAGVAGVDLDRAAAALGQAVLSSMRMQVVRTPGGGVVINDAYNANPTSMAAALNALAAVDADRRVAVVGLMAELDDPRPAHRAIARRSAELGIELVAVDTDLYGVEPRTVDDALAATGTVGARVAVLVKASRAVGLDRLAARLVEVS